jgi:hypothetical protein
MIIPIYSVEKPQSVVQVAIRQFGEKNKMAPPVQLFYYRDGVSDSEFDTVYQQEYQAIAGLFPRALLTSFRLSESF